MTEDLDATLKYYTKALQQEVAIAETVSTDVYALMKVNLQDKLLSHQLCVCGGRGSLCNFT